MGDIPVEKTQYKTDAIGTSQILTPPLAARPFTARSAHVGFTLVQQMFLNEVIKELNTINKKVKNIENGVNPCV